MSHIACPHCSQPIEDDPSLAGEAAVCPHCDAEFQFPEAPRPVKRASAASTSRRSPPGKTTTSIKSKSDVKRPPDAKKQTDAKKQLGGKSKTAGKEKPAPPDPKLMIASIAVAVLLLAVSLYFFFGRKRDYTAERQAVLSYISNTMTKAKFDSWHGEGIGKGCTTTNGVKIPDNSVVVRAHVLVGGKMKHKEDIVFLVVNGRVTNEIDPRNFRLPTAAAK